MQAGVRHAGRLLSLVELALQVQQPGLIGCGQYLAVCTQAFVAAAELARLLFNAALVCRQHLNLLLHLGHTGALLAGAFLGQAQGIFQAG